MPSIAPCIAITPGEPAGIGPDLLVQVAQQQHNARLVAFADPKLLLDRAQRLNLPLTVSEFCKKKPGLPAPGCLEVVPAELATLPEPGAGNADHARYVLNTLDSAIDFALAGHIDAVVTGPVNKYLINAGLADGDGDGASFFSGHTEYFAKRCGCEKVVMLLAAEKPAHLPAALRVALATTHLPLAAVPDAINQAMLAETLRILQRGLQEQFGIANPRILVCGLNPHAGEQGDLGREEIDIIQPCIEALRAKGMDLSNPMPADTLFTHRHLAGADAVLAMYHDQGLPVLKSHSFGQAVNITLGLPFIRTSVDHGTAFDLAGSGRADDSSLRAALGLAETLCNRRRDGSGKRSDKSL
ncbi:MAG: 4-hydroxythreonine-4-phosphate dehydrogenase PdxA [Gammaproteobacteria bacterium]|nr:4-hydroxythreonine-4-phosphate dehydrogenase PdxA [Gammaproteobacteria bacterium]NND38236.1 4-hydroxythreonine-4-phosphate dehydrogenase PdxA [Pseudomonadales bacterium]MBT8150335.1 4-hydroxythreonine-4-phosphate dehydrogenase PdxA [Gammaproteobacteria bacterium]NNL11998.1 4-hydroxythreonine-4-phosphate dehydrogenase PdxA [Pseudomonadales bacterium]NNM12032.1 4-hydroxythreonine-4-phosphate dehydrogenase PdxA [Pseudomonadales bacterium]